MHVRVVAKMWRIVDISLSHRTCSNPSLSALRRPFQERIGKASEPKHSVIGPSAGNWNNPQPAICDQSEKIREFSAYCSHPARQLFDQIGPATRQWVANAATLLWRLDEMLLTPQLIRSEIPVTSLSETTPYRDNGFLKYEASR